MDVIKQTALYFLVKFIYSKKPTFIGSYGKDKEVFGVVS